MHILLTRPLEDCSDLIIKFKELGHTVSHLPLIKIKKMIKKTFYAYENKYYPFFMDELEKEWKKILMREKVLDYLMVLKKVQTTNLLAQILCGVQPLIP